MKKIYFLFVLLISLQLMASELTTLTAPEVSTRLTEAYPIAMTSLKAYPIYINATVELPDTMQEVNVTINGDTFTAEAGTDFYYYLWTPDSFGNHEINITAVASSGDETTITRNVNVANSAASQTVTSLQDVVIEFNGVNSRWYYGTYTFPQFVGAYSTINSFLEVECPSITGGCDDWDRWAHIDVKGPDGNWIQLIRYITPYGVACSHELDLTDYMSLLQGEVELRVFIDTWGTGGWQLTLDMEYLAGAPDYDYSNVVEVWDAGYSFGDPANLQPVETFTATIPTAVEESHLRILNTGHGWGANNTSNAAEFFNAMHFIDIDGSETFSQHLFTDCNPNPDNCTGQQGTWQYSRAGWCPGAISQPYNYDLNAQIGASFELDYRFHPSYVDNCHPNNPNCISGTTCPDCNDGYNPIYYVDTHIINKSNTPIFYGDVLGVHSVDNSEIYDVHVYPNPSEGVFRVQTSFAETNTKLSIHTIDGKFVKSYYFDSVTDLNANTFDLSNVAKGIYFVNIQNNRGTGVKRIVIE